MTLGRCLNGLVVNPALVAIFLISFFGTVFIPIGYMEVNVGFMYSDTLIFITILIAVLYLQISIAKQIGVRLNTVI